jgi:Oxidoreductase-like protein, N-terminal
MVGHSLPRDRLRSHNLVECCMSGCAVCVHELYQESLDDYNASVAAVRASLTDMKVPEDEWPETIRPGAKKQTSLAASNSSLNAFREMERALKAQREAQAQS